MKKEWVVIYEGDSTVRYFKDYLTAYQYYCKLSHRVEQQALQQSDGEARNPYFEVMLAESLRISTIQATDNNDQGWEWTECATDEE